MLPGIWGWIVAMQGTVSCYLCLAINLINSQGKNYLCAFYIVYFRCSQILTLLSLQRKIILTAPSRIMKVTYRQGLWKLLIGKDYERYLSERIMKVTYRQRLWKLLIVKDYESYLLTRIRKVTYRQRLWKLLIGKDYESYLSSRIMKVTYRQGLWKLLIVKDYESYL